MKHILPKYRSPAPWIYLAFALFYLWMAAQVPYTHDDWDWGLDVGLTHLLTADINSRYAGNLFIVLMTRWEVLKVLILGGGCFLIPWLTAALVRRLTGAPQLPVFLISNALMLTMDRNILRQTCFWISGFANYGISCIFMLLCLIEWAALPDQTVRRSSLSRSLLFFAVSLTGQLYVEYLSIMLALLSAAVFAVSLRRKHPMAGQYGALALGCILGLGIVFSSSMYGILFSAGEAVDQVRGLVLSTDQGLSNILNALFGQASALFRGLCRSNHIAMLTLLILLTRALHTADGISNGQRRGFTVCNGAMLLFFLADLYYIHIRAIHHPSALFRAVELWGYFCFWVLVTAELCILHRQDSNRRSLLLFLWFSIPLLLAPMTMTTESGQRINFHSAVLLTVFLCVMLSGCLKGRWSARGCRIALCCALVPVLLLTPCLRAIGSCTQQRNALMEAARSGSASVITLPRYPHEALLWCPDPVNALRTAYFRAFFDIPDHVQLVFESQTGGS